MSHQLSGGAVDTLFVLFWFGPREAGKYLLNLEKPNWPPWGFVNELMLKTYQKVEIHICVYSPRKVTNTHI